MYWGGGRCSTSIKIKYIKICPFKQSFILFSGIFAYLNYKTPCARKKILEILINGLQRLEYRGYDSAGKLCVSSMPRPPGRSSANLESPDYGMLSSIHWMASLLKYSTCSLSIRFYIDMILIVPEEGP
jgi:hypothetical protein